MKFLSKNILITGGAGFIGSNFIKFLIKKYPTLNIINLDNLTYAGNLSNLSFISKKHNYSFIKGDICNTKLVNEIFKKHQIDGVINFAAESHVDNSIINPDIFIKTNVYGTYSLLNAAYNFWMHSPHKYKDIYAHARFHQISTDEIYGSISEGSSDENNNYLPNSPYSASKASADLIVRSFNITYGLNTTISISGNNFGANQHHEKFIPKIILSLIKGDTIPIYGNGNNVRDWIFVDDHCEAIDLIFNNASSGEKYNVGAMNEISNNELVSLIHKQISPYLKCNMNIKYVNDRFGHDFRYSLSTEKIKRDLGWSPKNNFSHQINLLVNEYVMEHNVSQ